MPMEAAVGNTPRILVTQFENSWRAVNKRISLLVSKLKLGFMGPGPTLKTMRNGSYFKHSWFHLYTLCYSECQNYRIHHSHSHNFHLDGIDLPEFRV